MRDSETASDEPEQTRSAGGRRVLISGGSMGGLFAGHALAADGGDVTVFERSAGRLEHRGGGIVAQPRMMRFLSARDIADASALTTESRRRVYLTPDGGVDRSYREEMRFTGWDTVYRRLRDAFPEDRYREGRRVVDHEQTDETVTVALDDGETATGDLFVAAEGWQSATRERLLPDATPKYAGYVAWRGVAPERSLADDLIREFDGTFTFFGGEGQLILAYPIPGPDGETGQGDRRLNWVWYDRVTEVGLDRVLTDRSGQEHSGSVPPGELRADVEAGLRESAEDLPPRFERLVRSTGDPFVQAIVDLSVESMAFGRVCLLGDTAFVARPHTAAGTEKAARDAVELAAELDRRDDVASALAAWERSQLPYGRRLVEKGKRMGIERLSTGS